METHSVDVRHWMSNIQRIALSFTEGRFFGRIYP